MQALSSTAVAILEQMEPNRCYEPAELRAFVPDMSMESLREIMHELWLNRHVERFGYAGWRRDSSVCASEEAPDPRSCAGCRIARSCARYAAPAQDRTVRPEDLFDHDSFDGMFK